MDKRQEFIWKLARICTLKVEFSTGSRFLEFPYTVLANHLHIKIESLRKIQIVEIRRRQYEKQVLVFSSYKNPIDLAQVPRECTLKEIIPVCGIISSSVCIHNHRPEASLIIQFDSKFLLVNLTFWIGATILRIFDNQLRQLAVCQKGICK